MAIEARIDLAEIGKRKQGAEVDGFDIDNQQRCFPGARKLGFDFAAEKRKPPVEVRRLAEAPDRSACPETAKSNGPVGWSLFRLALKS